MNSPTGEPMSAPMGPARVTLAWHFCRVMPDGSFVSGPVGASWGTKIVAGRWQTIRGGSLLCCVRGLHASLCAIDALAYSGPGVSRVECVGIEDRQDDKFVCRKRRALWVYDASEELLAFSANAAMAAAMTAAMAADAARRAIEGSCPAYGARQTVQLDHLTRDAQNARLEEMLTEGARRRGLA